MRRPTGGGSWPTTAQSATSGAENPRLSNQRPCLDSEDVLRILTGSRPELVRTRLCTDVAAALQTWMRAREAVTCWGSVELVIDRRPAAGRAGLLIRGHGLAARATCTAAGCRHRKVGGALWLARSTNRHRMSTRVTNSPKRPPPQPPSETEARSSVPAAEPQPVDGLTAGGLGGFDHAQAFAPPSVHESPNAFRPGFPASDAENVFQDARAISLPVVRVGHRPWWMDALAHLPDVLRPLRSRLRPARRGLAPRVSGSERPKVRVVTPLLARPAVHRIHFDGISRAGRQFLGRIEDGVMIAADAVRDAPPIAKVFAVGVVIIVTSALALDSGASTKRAVALKRPLHVAVSQTRPAPRETARLASPIVASPAGPAPAHHVHPAPARKQLPPKPRRPRRAAQHPSAAPAAPQVTPQASSQVTPQVTSQAAAAPLSQAAPAVSTPVQSYTPPRPAPVTHAPRPSQSSSEFGFER